MNKLRIMAGVTICIGLFLSVMYLAGKEAEPVRPVETITVETSEYEKYVEFIEHVSMYGVTDEQINALESDYNIAKFPNDDIARAKLANAKVSKYNQLLRGASTKDAKHYRTELLRLDGVIKSTGLEPTIPNHHDVYHKPTDLFYGFLWYDGVYVSQSFDEHVANNGLKGIDVATAGRSLSVHAPDLYNKEVEWKVSIPSVGCKKRSIGQCIYFTNDTHRVIYGHMASWNGKEKVKTGDNVGIVGGCGGDPNEGASTGCHLHIEYQNWDKYKNDWVNFEYTLSKSNKHENKAEDNGLKLAITSYNPEVGQTDDTPCVAGGTGMDICQLAKEGVRTLALSQELISWGINTNYHNPFTPGQKVVLETIEGTAGHGDPRCNGEFIIADAMNARFKRRGDIFFMDRKHNISCNAYIYKI